MYWHTHLAPCSLSIWYVSLYCQGASLSTNYDGCGEKVVLWALPKNATASVAAGGAGVTAGDMKDGYQVTPMCKWAKIWEKLPPDRQGENVTGSLAVNTFTDVYLRRMAMYFFESHRKPPSLWWVKFVHSMAWLTHLLPTIGPTALHNMQPHPPCNFAKSSTSTPRHAKTTVAPACPHDVCLYISGHLWI